MAARQAGSAVGSMRNVSVSALSKNLADELGPQGINVTTVHPGMTYTERIPAMLEERAKVQGITVEEAELQMAGGNSIKRKVVPALGGGKGRSTLVSSSGPSYRAGEDLVVHIL